MSSHLFQRPDPISDLTDRSNLVIAVAALCERLASEERTYVDHADGRPENVAEHCFLLAKVAVLLADAYYPDLDHGKIALYAMVHDDVEAYVGDTSTDPTANVDYQAKHDRELHALEQLSADYRPFSDAYIHYVTSYEEQTVPEARFVRMVDKVVVATQAYFDDGAVIKDKYTYDQFVAFQLERAKVWGDEYPEFTEVISIRTDMQMYLARKHLLPSAAGSSAAEASTTTKSATDAGPSKPPAA